MQVLTRSSQVLTHPTTGNSQQNTAIGIRQSMISRHTCLCCSDTLLRHIGSGGIYWRCSHCYQEMPVKKQLQSLKSTLACDLCLYIGLTPTL